MLKTESRVLLGFGLVMGLAALWLVPPFITYDGPSHFYRTIQVSSGQFRPIQRSARDIGGAIPQRDSQFLDALWGGYWSRHDFGHMPAWRRQSELAAVVPGSSYQPFTNSAIYSPLNYAFAAFGFAAAQRFSASPLLGERMACLANLIAYLAFMTMAIEWLPAGEWAVAVLATSPLALMQAASVSADPMNFALPILLVSGVAKLRAQSEPRPALAAICLLLVPVVVLLKPVNLCLVACVALIPGKHFGHPLRKALLLGLSAAVAGGAWWFWNRPYLDIDLSRFFDATVPSSGAIKAWFRENPLRFLPALNHAFTFDFWDQWPGAFGGVGGWISPAARAGLVPLSLFCLIGMLAGATGKRARPDFAWSTALGIQAVAFITLLALVLWLTYAQVGVPTSLTFRHSVVPYFGGRYLLAVYLILALAIAELLAGRLPERLRYAAWLGFAANGAFLVLLLKPLAG